MPPPGGTWRSTASSAARPDAKAKAWRAPSSEAMHRSSAARVGLPLRAYSQPRWRATPSWANVVDRLIGGTTAPVTGSGSWPTWMARVSNPRSSLVAVIAPRRSRSRRRPRQVLEDVGPPQHGVRAAARQHDERRGRVEQLDRGGDRLADAHRRQRVAHDLLHRLVEHVGVAEGPLHERQLVDR